MSSIRLLLTISKSDESEMISANVRRGAISGLNVVRTTGEYAGEFI